MANPAHSLLLSAGAAIVASCRPLRVPADARPAAERGEKTGKREQHIKANRD